MVASSASRERMLSHKCVKNHGLWPDTVPNCPPNLCPSGCRHRATLQWDRDVPRPCHCNWKPLASSQTEVDLTGLASGLPKGQSRGRVGGDVRK